MHFNWNISLIDARNTQHLFFKVREQKMRFNGNYKNTHISIMPKIVSNSKINSKPSWIIRKFFRLIDWNWLTYIEFIEADYKETQWSLIKLCNLTKGTSFLKHFAKVRKRKVKKIPANSKCKCSEHGMVRSIHEMIFPCICCCYCICAHIVEQ